jgi:hypothetical protein
VQPPRIEHLAAAAEALALLDGEPAPPTPALPQPVRTSALAARGLTRGCERAQTQWLQGISAVVGASSPYVERDALGAVLGRLRASPCGRSLDELGQRRFALLEAINARDAAGMAEHGRYLLESGRVGERERVHYFLAAVTGELARGGREKAREIVLRQRHLLAERDRDRFIVRLVSAHALQTP